MRLSAPDFEGLLTKPVVGTLSLQETQKMIALGDQKTSILSNCIPKGAQPCMIDGVINRPMFLICKNLSKLQQGARGVTPYDSGKRTELDTYISNENGFTAHVLDPKQTNIQEIT